MMFRKSKPIKRWYSVDAQCNVYKVQYSKGNGIHFYIILDSGKYTYLPKDFVQEFLKSHGYDEAEIGDVGCITRPDMLFKKKEKNDE